MADILSYSLRSTFAKEFYQSLTDPASDDRYYMAYGRIKPWDGDTPTTVDTIKEQNDFKRNVAFYQRILPSDVCLMAPRYDWTSGVIYDEYQDDVELWAEGKQYYVLVQDVDQYNVYICLYNNNGAVSTETPTGTDTEEILTGDGYIWKYLYTLTLELEEFLTLNYIPVLILDKLSYNDERALALDVKYNAVSGIIENITVDTAGIFSNLYLVNTQLTTSHQVSTVDGLTFTAALTSDHSSTNNYYDTNYVVYFESGKIGTVDTYTISGNTITITLCELYPDDGTPIETGENYSILPKVKVTGNGTGAVAVPVFNGEDVLTSINVINGGQDYNFAESFFLVNSGAVISAVIPPKGGHGYDAVNELKPTHILIKKNTDFAAIPDDQEKYFGSGTFVRQLGIVRNITTNAGTNPDEQIDEYDMVLKETQVFSVSFNDNFIDDTFITAADTTGGNLFTLNKTYSCKTALGNDWQGILVKKNNILGTIWTYTFKSLTPDKDIPNLPLTSTIFTEVQSGSTINFISTEQKYDYFYDIQRLNLGQLPLYTFELQFASFNNASGNMYYLDTQNSFVLDGTNPTIGHGFYNKNFTPNFFETDDVISLRDKNNTEVLKLRVIGVQDSPYSYRTSFYGSDPTISLGSEGYSFSDYINLPDGVFGTSVFFEYISGTIPEQTAGIAPQDAFPKRYYNETKNIEMNLFATYTLTNGLDGELEAREFNGPRILIGSAVVTNSGIPVNAFFSDPDSAPTTAPTHILGNDTLSVAKINSLIVDTQDNTKFNLKISEPTGDFEPAVIEEGTVVSGESVTLLRATPTTAFTRSFEKIGNTDSVYVLSENFDINNPANIPTTITSSVVSKLQVKRTGNTVLNNSIIPIGSYLYREATDTIDAAAGYVTAIDEKVTVGSDATMYVYVQMEKGSFSVDDIISCVEDAFVKDITLYNGTCAGNSGVTITISETEQRYDNLFLNKYSGEVLYIQNTDPIQMATDTHFTTRILLGF